MNLDGWSIDTFIRQGAILIVVVLVILVAYEVAT